VQSVPDLLVLIPLRFALRMALLACILLLSLAVVQCSGQFYTGGQNRLPMLGKRASAIQASSASAEDEVSPVDQMLMRLTHWDINDAKKRSSKRTWYMKPSALARYHINLENSKNKQLQ